MRDMRVWDNFNNWSNINQNVWPYFALEEKRTCLPIELRLARRSRSVFNLEFLCAIEKKASGKCLSEQPSCFLSISSMPLTHFIRAQWEGWKQWENAPGVLFFFSFSHLMALCLIGDHPAVNTQCSICPDSCEWNFCVIYDCAGHCGWIHWD